MKEAALSSIVEKWALPFSSRRTMEEIGEYGGEGRLGAHFPTDLLICPDPSTDRKEIQGETM